MKPSTNWTRMTTKNSSNSTRLRLCYMWIVKIVLTLPKEYIFIINWVFFLNDLINKQMFKDCEVFKSNK